jgi:hypothetical protein
MNRAFDEVLAAGTETMLSAFDTTALRLGTASQNIEKDFWVCWTLDALFHGLKEGGPRLLFKGGTSLSKGFGLINRFSEDIDVTVFRDDIGEPATIEELNALSNNKRRARLDAIKAACQAYINGPLRNELTQILAERLKAAGLDAGAARVEADDTDADKQTLLIWYPTATPQSLSEEARNAPGATCPAAALAGEVARQPDALKRVFAEGVERMIVSIANSLPKATSPRDEALDIVCRMLGALVLARAMPASSSLGRELLATATDRCRKSAMTSNRSRRDGSSPKPKG